MFDVQISKFVAIWYTTMIVCLILQVLVRTMEEMQPLDHTYAANTREATCSWEVINAHTRKADVGLMKPEQWQTLVENHWFCWHMQLLHIDEQWMRCHAKSTKARKGHCTLLLSFSPWNVAGNAYGCSI